jgi:hypothetical protein
VFEREIYISYALAIVTRFIIYSLGKFNSIFFIFRFRFFCCSPEPLVEFKVIHQRWIPFRLPLSLEFPRFIFISEEIHSPRFHSLDETFFLLFKRTPIFQFRFSLEFQMGGPLKFKDRDCIFVFVPKNANSKNNFVRNKASIWFLSLPYL